MGTQAEGNRLLLLAGSTRVEEREGVAQGDPLTLV